MTDKQFIETLKNIKNYCTSTNCNRCKLAYRNRARPLRDCVLQGIIFQLDMSPNKWNIENIERTLKQYD